MEVLKKPGYGRVFRILYASRYAAVDSGDASPERHCQLAL